MCVQSLSVTFCLSYRPTFLSFFHSLTCWQDIYFCRCVIVLKIANYTAELKQILFNYYFYSVSSSQYSFSFTSTSSSMLNSCVVVLQRAVMQPQLFLSWLSSISLNKPTGPFPWTAISDFLQAYAEIQQPLQHSSPLLPKARKMHFNWRLT